MKRHALLLIPALLLMALPAFAGEGHEQCTADAQTCLDKMATKVASKGWMGVEGEADEATGFFKVTSVAADSPAYKAGFKEGYLVSAVNGHAIDMNDEAAMHEVMSLLVPDAHVTFTVAKGHGKEKNLEVTLIEMPEAEKAKIVGGHMLSHVTVADTSSR